MKSNRTYTLTLDEQQYQDIITAVETFHRLISGQPDEINCTGLFHVSDETLRQLKKEMFPELDLRASYSWDGGHDNKSLDRLQAATYAIYRQMLHVRTVDNNSPEWNTYLSPTLTCGKAKLPKIKIENQCK